jgi:hypothetical protein
MFEGKALPFGETITLDEAGHVHHEHAAVQRDEQVEALLLPDLADDDAFGSHPECLLDEASESHLAGALEVRLPGLHSDDVGERQPQALDAISTHVVFWRGCIFNYTSRRRTQSASQARRQYRPDVSGSRSATAQPVR